MNKPVYAMAAFAVVFGISAPAFADDGPFKGRTAASGANCQRNTFFDIEASIVGATVEGTIKGDAFRGPVKFAGTATDNSFTATHVFVNLNNLRVEITGTRTDASTFAFATKWNGGGPNNCQSTGTGKKA